MPPPASSAKYQLTAISLALRERGTTVLRQLAFMFPETLVQSTPILFIDAGAKLRDIRPARLTSVLTLAALCLYLCPAGVAQFITVFRQTPEFGVVVSLGYIRAMGP